MLSTIHRFIVADSCLSKGAQQIGLSYAKLVLVLAHLRKFESYG